MPLPNFGGLIRQLRDERGWTQEQLAREAGITVTCLSNLERGATKEPNTETISDRIVSLPLFPTMTDADQDRVVAAMDDLFKKGA